MDLHLENFLLHLAQLIFINNDDNTGASTLRKLHRVEDMPVPAATVFGEPLIAFPVNTHGGSRRQTCVFEVHGRESGERYFDVTVLHEKSKKETDADGKDLLRVYAAALSIGLHHPYDVDDTLREMYQAANGTPLEVGCSVCEEKFQDFKDVFQHELEAHGLDTADCRPRIGQVTQSDLAAFGISDS